jgi:2-dehydropantoate 2-reductase
VILSALNGIPWWFFEGFDGPLRGRRLRSVDPAGEIARALPPEQSVGCVVYLAAYVDADGIVCPSPGEKLVLGDAMPGTGSLLRAERIASLLRKAGFAPEIAKSIQREVWVKLWGNLTANPIGALTGSTIEGMLHNHYTLRLVTSMMAEARALANYLGLDLGMDIPQRMQGMRRLVGVKSSMLQDIEAGRALELDTIIGAVSEIGDMAGVDTPFIDAVLGLIQQRAGHLGLWKPPATEA